MSTVQEHYANLLARHYTWMFGSRDAMVEANGALFVRHDIAPKGSGRAVDLGAGSGFQTLALAMHGFAVTAVDTSRELLDELRANAGDWPIRVIEGDLLELRRFAEPGIELAVCMGDTLPHLPSRDAVRGLFEDLHTVLAPDGRFVVSWRDMTRELAGLERFIPVRADDTTVFTCFLEYHPEHVQVHDLVYTKHDDGWHLSTSSYPKLRLGKAWVIEELRRAGFDITAEDEARGQTVIVARKR